MFLEVFDCFVGVGLVVFEIELVEFGDGFGWCMCVILYVDDEGMVGLFVVCSYCVVLVSLYLLVCFVIVEVVFVF